LGLDIELEIPDVESLRDSSYKYRFEHPNANARNRVWTVFVSEGPDVAVLSRVV
jgi:hypothetical protein